MPALSTSSGFGLNIPNAPQYNPLEVRPIQFVNGKDFAGQFDTRAMPSGVESGIALGKPLADAIMSGMEEARKRNLLEKGQVANRKSLDDALANGDQVDVTTDELGNIAYRRKPLTELEKQEQGISLEMLKAQKDNLPTVIAQRSAEITNKTAELGNRAKQLDFDRQQLEANVNMAPDLRKNEAARIANETEKLNQEGSILEMQKNALKNSQAAGAGAGDGSGLIPGVDYVPDFKNPLGKKILTPPGEIHQKQIEAQNAEAIKRTNEEHQSSLKKADDLDKDLSDAVSQANNNISVARDFLEQNKNYQNTGADPYSKFQQSMSNFRGSEGYRNLQNMQADAGKLAVQQLPKGLGLGRNITEFNKATSFAPGTDKDPEVNKRILESYILSNENAKDYAQYWTALKKQSKDKAEAATQLDDKWNEYMEANPLWVRDPKTGVQSVNQNRQTWKQYFGAQAGKSGGQPQGAGQSQSVSAPAQSGQLPVVNSTAEFNSLPSGTKFRDSYGNVGTKK